MMRAITSFVFGLLLSAVLLLPTNARAAELEPFLTVKASSINTFIGIAEMFAGMADAADDYFFQEAINGIRNIRGVNFDGDFGIAAVVTENDTLNFLFVLPVTDIWRLDFPEAPGMIEGLRPFLTRRSAERTDINTPFGNFVALQRQGFLVVVPEEIIDRVPANPRTLFADLEQYTFGMKFDLEKVEFETLEANFFTPILLMALMQAPEMADQLEEAIEMYRLLFDEFAMVSYGIAVDRQTADIELSYSFAAREGSDMARVLAGYERRPTIFGGFRGTPENNVFSFGDSARAPAMPNNALMGNAKAQWEIMLDGIIEQIEMDDDTGEAGKIAREAIDAIFKIIEDETQRGENDMALSFNIDGTLLAAFDTVSLAEIQTLAILAWDFARSRAPAEAEELLEVRLGYTTIEGFTVSSFKIPLIPLAETFMGPGPGARHVPQGPRELAINGFWATKPGGKQAIAFAAGVDAAKTEAAFRSALQQTATPVPVQEPAAVFSMQGWGKFLQQTVQPILEQGTAESPGHFPQSGLEDFKKQAEVLASADADATVTMSFNTSADRVDVAFRMSGKIIQTIIDASKATMPPPRPGIRSF